MGSLRYIIIDHLLQIVKEIANMNIQDEQSKSKSFLPADVKEQEKKSSPKGA